MLGVEGYPQPTLGALELIWALLALMMTLVALEAIFLWWRGDE